MDTYGLLDPRDAEDVYPDSPRGMSDAEAAYEALDMDHPDAAAQFAAWKAEFQPTEAVEEDDDEGTAAWVAGLVRAAEREAEGAFLPAWRQRMQRDGLPPKDMTHA